jgi:hypothetical protein
MTHNFKPELGLKTYQGAAARLRKIEDLVPGSVCLIATEYGLYYPVCCIREPDRHNMFAVASTGVTVIG